MTDAQPRVNLNKDGERSGRFRDHTLNYGSSHSVIVWLIGWAFTAGATQIVLLFSFTLLLLKPEGQDND